MIDLATLNLLISNLEALGNAMTLNHRDTLEALKELRDIYEHRNQSDDKGRRVHAQHHERMESP